MIGTVHEYLGSIVLSITPEDKIMTSTPDILLSIGRWIPINISLLHPKLPLDRENYSLN